MYYAMGLTEEEIYQPFIGVATTWNESAPCNITLGRQAQSVKIGVKKNGGTPREFTTITVTDGIAMGHEAMKASLVSREVIADSVELSVRENLQREDDFGLNEFKTYRDFTKRVEKSRNDLVELLVKLKNDGKRVMSIGATAKSTTVFNYCGFGTDLIELITDTTKDKQGKYSPGSHIPVVPRESVNLNDYDYAFLGAWNLKDYIIKNEKKFNGKFITHVPKVEVI